MEWHRLVGWIELESFDGDGDLFRFETIAVADHGHDVREAERFEGTPWILEPSATGLCEPDLHVFAKPFEDRLERGLEAQALSGREIGGDDDVLNFFVGHLVDVDLTRQPAS